MSSIIKFSVAELRRLATSGTACVEERRVTQSLALQPWCLANLKDSVKNLLDYKIGKFDKEYNGILLSYKNLHILQNIGAIRNDHTDIHFQVQADFFIFRPHIGAILRGIVNKKCVTHLGILVHRVFNVVIPRPTEEPGSRWIGTRVQEGQEVTFKIVMLDLFGALPYIRGELDESCLENLPDGDELSNTPPEKLAPHVNFDNVRPHAQRQIGDAPEDSRLSPSRKEESKPNTKPSLKSVKSRYLNGKAQSPAPEEGKDKKKRPKMSDRSNGSDLAVRQNKKLKNRDS